MSRLKALAAAARGGTDAASASKAQRQTAAAFGYQWSRQDSYESPSVQQAGLAWLLERYCDNNPGMVDRWLTGGRKIILDAGCGSGYSAVLLFGDRLKEHDYLGVDFSGAVEVARRRFAARGLPGEFVETDVTRLGIPEESVDLVFSEGVLHHTDDAERALCFLTGKLKHGGRFLFYVYARKGPIREFADDHIRQALHPLGDREAWEALKPLTKLGIELGKLNAQVNVPEAIDCLGIPAGPIDVQRLVYWYFCKMFYHPEYSLEETNHINFDWYRPLNCHRFSPQEVEQFCRRAGLTIERMNVQPAGITVVAVRT